VKFCLPSADWRHGAGADYIEARAVAALQSDLPSVQDAMIFNAERRAWKLVQDHSAIIERVAV
jgi:hypothetical protein